MEKVIHCSWIEEKDYGYGKVMKVIKSNHPRFVIGSRFDFDFLHIANNEGYKIIINPVPNELVN